MRKKILHTSREQERLRKRRNLVLARKIACRLMTMDGSENNKRKFPTVERIALMKKMKHLDAGPGCFYEEEQGERCFQNVCDVIRQCLDEVRDND